MIVYTWSVVYTFFGFAYAWWFWRNYFNPLHPPYPCAEKSRDKKVKSTIEGE